MANPRYDLVVIGSGPGGYVAAIRASQLKMKAAVIERDRLGGICLNWGCIPSKALLNSAETMETIAGAAKEHGIQAADVRFDFKHIIRRSRQAAEKLSRGVGFLLKKNSIDLFEAEASIGAPQAVVLRQVPGKPALARETIEAERIIIATGSGERLLPGMTIGDGLITSKEALALDDLPGEILIIGAGAIGAEFAYFYRAFGAKVTVVEMENQMLPGIDAEVAEELRRSFVRRGITVLVGHRYQSAERRGRRWAVTVGAQGEAKVIEADAVLVAVGRGPLSANLGLEKAGVETEKSGFIKVNDSFQTACPTVYAIGDVIGPPLLAHKASAQGVAAVEIMAGVRQSGFDPLGVPACIYCEPEVATVGLSEADARGRGIEVKVGKFPFRANGKAVATNQVEGFVKLVTSRQYGEVIGCQIIGRHATDLVSEIVLGKMLETTSAELGRAIHPHPTLSEAIMEAALAAEGEAINL